MKALFKVVDTSKKSIPTIETFGSKGKAKGLRNKLNKDSDIKPFRVSRGEDHWKGESFPKQSENTKKKIKDGSK